MSKQEWEAEQQAKYEERQRAQEQRRLDAETEAMTERWRSEVADKPAAPETKAPPDVLEALVTGQAGFDLAESYSPRHDET